jgi:RluA family pseudouridine synthase
MKKSRPTILFEDDHLLAVDKPAGISVIPERFAPPGESLVEQLRVRHPELMVVHRLDRETTGVLLFARDPDSHREMSMAFEAGSIQKIYLALVEGAPMWDEQTMNLPLRTNVDRRHRTVADPGRGKPAVTHYRVIERLGPFSLVEARPETGRTHQIRVHLAAAGAACAVDELYGSGQPVLLSNIKRNYKEGAREERPLLARLGLHAHSLSFAHPSTKDPVEIVSELPRDIAATLSQLRKNI